MEIDRRKFLIGLAAAAAGPAMAPAEPAYIGVDLASGGDMTAISIVRQVGQARRFQAFVYVVPGYLAAQFDEIREIATAQGYNAVMQQPIPRA